MRYLLNFYNQTAAGPITLTRTFINTLFSEIKNNQNQFEIILPNIPAYKDLRLKRGKKKNMNIIFLSYLSGIGRFMLLFLYNFIIFPLLALLFHPKAILSFGNFAPLPLISKKIVLMHHSYLVDDELLAEAGFKTKFIEHIKRIIFLLTTRTSNSIVVETDYIKKMIIKKYNVSENVINVIANPLSKPLCESTLKNLEEGRIPHEMRRFVLYVSRYALHKNYAFLLDLVDKHRNKFQDTGVKFYITVDPNLNSKAAEYIQEIKSRNLNTIIKNLGEISHKELKDYYKKALCLFFPSKSETCGLPLIEAMAFGLPIVVPDLFYVRDICEEAALYYKPTEIDDAFQKIWSLFQEESLWRKYSNKSIKQFNKYPTAKEWVKKYLNLLKN